MRRFIDLLIILFMIGHDLNHYRQEDFNNEVQRALKGKKFKHNFDENISLTKVSSKKKSQKEIKKSREEVKLCWRRIGSQISNTLTQTFDYLKLKKSFRDSMESLMSIY